MEKSGDCREWQTLITYKIFSVKESPAPARKYISLVQEH
jgi:hypothetical protein